MTMRRIQVWMLTALLAVSGFAVSAGELSPVPPSCSATSVETELPAAEGELFQPEWQAKNACTEECGAYFIECLDGCDAWPYPGCYQDCRTIRNLCYQECF